MLVMINHNGSSMSRLNASLKEQQDRRVMWRCDCNLGIRGNPIMSSMPSLVARLIHVDHVGHLGGTWGHIQPKST